MLELLHELKGQSLQLEVVDTPLVGRARLGMDTAVDTLCNPLDYS